MRGLGWLCLIAGLGLQVILPLRLWVPEPDAVWWGVPATVLLMGVGLLGVCAGVCIHYWGGLAAYARALDDEAAGRGKG